MQTPTCSLCKSKPANQTGSHIFSWFLIRDCINKANVKRRHNEITFSMSPKDFVNTYIGSEIQPDEILRIKGRDLTDEEIEALKSSNPFTKDNILCSECEKKLSVLEAEVEQNVFAKLRKYKVNNINSFDIIEEENGGLLRLFIYSLAWRASLVHQNDFLMNKEHEEILREILNTNLNLKSEDLKRNIKSNEQDIKKLPLIVTFSEIIGNNDNYVYCSLSKMPYAMLLNDLSFQLFFKKKQINSNDYFQGINTIINKKQMVNIGEDKFKIAVLSNERRLWVNGNLGKYMFDKVMRLGISRFREGFKVIFKKPAPSGLIEYFKFKIASGANKQIENFTATHFFNAAMEVMIDYCRAIGIRLKQN